MLLWAEGALRAWDKSCLFSETQINSITTSLGQSEVSMNE